MSSVAISLLVFGIYLVATGLGLSFAPNMFLGMLGQPATVEPWIRVAGVVTLVIGYYYIQAARADLRSFYMWTVQARVAVFVLFAAFIVFRWAPLTLALFGVIDLLGAIWTFFTFKAPSPIKR